MEKYLFNVYTFCKALYVINVGSQYGLTLGPHVYFIFILSDVVGWDGLLKTRSPLSAPLLLCALLQDSHIEDPANGNFKQAPHVSLEI